MLKSLKRVSGETTQAMQYVFKLRRTFTILMVLSFSYSFGQIQGTIFGLSEINAQLHFVRVNPNTGFVTSMGIQTSPQGWEQPFGSSAINCNSSYYAYGAGTPTGEQVFVLDNQSGSLMTTFGYRIWGMVYNEVTNRYYGLEPVAPDSANFVSFDPILGIRNVLSPLPIPITNPNDLLYSGFTIDVNTGRYIFLDVVGVFHSINTIDISTGLLINSVPVTLDSIPYSTRFYGISFAHDNSTCYGLTMNMNYGYQIFCSVNPATGVITKLDSTLDPALTGPENDGLSSATTISESDHVLTYISYYNKIVSYNYISGSISSYPSLSTNGPLYFIQYSNCSLVGMEQQSIEIESIAVSPNPNDGLCNVSIPFSSLGTEYVITDALGRAVFSGVFENIYTVIDLTGLANGIYFLHTSANNATSKIMINSQPK